LPERSLAERAFQRRRDPIPRELALVAEKMRDRLDVWLSLPDIVGVCDVGVQEDAAHLVDHVEVAKGQPDLVGQVFDATVPLNQAERLLRTDPLMPWLKSVPTRIARSISP